MRQVVKGKKEVASTSKTKTTRRKKSTGLSRPHKQKYGTSKLELRFAAEFMDKLGVPYVYEYEAKDIGRYYDFAIVATLPDTDVIYTNRHGVRCIDEKKQYVRVLACIEVDGSYFHSDERVVSEDKMNPMQKHNKMVDRLKDEWCQKHHIPLLRIWELDINTDPSGTMKKLKAAVEEILHANAMKMKFKARH